MTSARFDTEADLRRAMAGGDCRIAEPDQERLRQAKTSATPMPQVLAPYNEIAPLPAKPGPSDIEILMHQLIRQAGVPEHEIMREVLLVPERNFRTDFYIPAAKLCIEVDGVATGGKHHHQTKAGIASDCEKRNTLLLAGYMVLHFTGRQVREVELVRAQLRQALGTTFSAPSAEQAFTDQGAAI